MNKVLNFIKSHIKITVFLAIFLLIIVAGINFAYSIFTPKTLEGVSVSDLSTCQGTDLLNNSPAMQGTYAYIEPMGNRASFNGIVGHVFPVDHIYFAFNHVSPNDLESPTIETNVYAPADVEIYQITDKKYSVNNKTIQHDYLLYMAPCNGVEIRFDHIKTINQTLLESINNATSNCQNGSQGGGIEGSTITSCIFNVNVKVKSGEMIGVAGGAGSQQQSFDFGLYDTRMKPQSFVDPKIDGPYNLYAACPLYYYSDSIVKTNLFKSINNKQINSNGLPDCGTNMWDKSGTIQGNWIRQGSSLNEVPPDNADGLSIAPLNTNPSMGNIDWGGSIAQAGSITFPISNKGIVNRDPSQVTSDEKIYCFQGENNMNGSPISIIIQLETNTLLKAEYLQEACPMNPQFHSPTSYIR